MASMNLAAVIGALASTIPGNVVRQVNRATVLLSLLPIVENEPATAINWDAEGDGAYAESYADGANVSTYGVDPLSKATLAFGSYRTNVQITGQAAAAAEAAFDSAGDAAPGKLRDLLGRQLDNGITKLSSYINGDLYNGTGTGGGGEPTIVGFRGGAIGTSNVYASIDRSVSGNAFFRSTVTDPGTPTILSFDQIRADQAAIFSLCNMNPDIALVGPVTHTKVKGLFDQSRRWESEVKVGTAMRGEVILENRGSVVDVEGTQFIRDKDMAEGQILYLNTAHTDIIVERQAKNFGAPAELFSTLSPEELQWQKLLRAMKAVELARLGDARQFFVNIYLGLRLNRPNTCGWRKNVAYT